LLLWSEPVIEGSIHSPHPVAHPSGRAKPRDAKMLPAFLSGFGHQNLKNPPLAGFCFCGANPLSKVRYTRHILWLTLRVARSRAMQKCSRHFCPGSGTIFKEPASGGFFAFV